MLGKQLKALGSAKRSNVWFLEGGEPNTGKVLRVIFIGGDQQKEYIARLIYNSDCLSTWAGKLYLLQIQYLLHRNSSNSALAFIEGHGIQQYLFQGKSDFYIPLWLESCVRIPLRATTKGAKEDLRRIRKHKLTHELTDDVESAKDFYENMYLPTIRARHGNSAISASFDELKSVLGRPDNKLLLIRHEETIIAGVVIQIQEMPRLWLAGIRDSSKVYRRMGAVGATYHFPAQYLAGRGYREMDLGRSRSFLHDGVFLYKSKWNHRLCGFDRDGMVARVLTITEALAGFLTNQAFVSVSNGQLHANVFVDASSDPGVDIPEVIETLNPERNIPGVSTFIIDGERGTIRKSNDR